VHGLLPQPDLDLLDRLGRVARKQVAELRVALGADRPLEARDGAAELSRLVQLAERDVGRLRELLVRRGPLELDGELTLDPGDLPLALADVDG
jgi:hypothetical protein